MRMNETTPSEPFALAFPELRGKISQAHEVQRPSPVRDPVFDPGRPLHCGCADSLFNVAHFSIRERYFHILVVVDLFGPSLASLQRLTEGRGDLDPWSGRSRWWAARHRRAAEAAEWRPWRRGGSRSRSRGRSRCLGRLTGLIVLATESLSSAGCTVISSETVLTKSSAAARCPWETGSLISP